ncbi:MAG: hypothetical protein ABIH38_00535 [Patescibacteria group bacterium]
MPEITPEIDRLLMSDPDKARSTSHIFIAHPTPLEEKGLGKIFLICEIDSSDKINHEIINVIQEQIKNNFYYAEENHLETAFENALQKVNEALHHLLSEGITAWLDKFNIIIGVLKNTELILAPIGRMHAFLIHREKIIDILGAGESRDNKVNPLKIFSHIVSGNLNPNDQLLFCTSSLLDYFSQEKLKRIINSSVPRESVNQLEQILLATDQKTAFGAIIIKLVPTKAPSFGEYKPQSAAPLYTSAPQTSMDELQRQEQKTSQYLSPSLLPNVFKSIGQYSGGINDFVRTKIFKKAPKRRVTESYYRPVKKEESKIKKIPIYLYLGIRWLIVKMAAAFRYIIQVFQGKEKIKGKLKELPYQTEQTIHGGIFRFRRLSKKARRTLVIALVILFVFCTSIVIIGLNKENKISAEQKDQMVKEIQDKSFQAGTALTYQDENGAKKLINEAQNLLNQLNKKIDKEQFQTLQNGINEQYEKTKHIVNIENPDLLKDLAALDPATSALDLFYFSNLLYLFNGDEIIKIDLESKEAETLKSTLTDIGQFTLGVKENNTTLLFYQDKNGVVAYNTAAKKFTPLSITFENQETNIMDLSFYQSRFYYLDIRNNQIYRHVAATAGFGPAVPWITDPDLNVSNGVSITVDGSIYLLKNNGQVMELIQGQPVDFSLDEIDPKLAGGKKIWTDETAEYIYILDPANKRLVQFDKNGNLKNQYTSGQFTGLKGFAISEKDKKAYLLAGTKVFQIDINI